MFATSDWFIISREWRSRICMICLSFCFKLLRVATQKRKKNCSADSSIFIGLDIDLVTLSDFFLQLVKFLCDPSFKKTCRGGNPEYSSWGYDARSLQILTVFRTKKCHYSHPFSDLVSKPHTRFQTRICIFFFLSSSNVVLK